MRCSVPVLVDCIWGCRLCLTQCLLHALATLQTQIRRALEALTTRRRLALTGYPLQNNLSEM